MVSLKDIRPYDQCMIPEFILFIGLLLAWSYASRHIARYLHDKVFKNPLHEERTRNILSFTPLVLFLLLDAFGVFG